MFEYMSTTEIFVLMLAVIVAILLVGFVFWMVYEYLTDKNGEE